MANLKLQNKSKILKSNYSDSLSLTLDAIEVGLRSVNPKSIIENSIEMDRNYLSITDYSGKQIDFDLGSFRRIYLVGAGKATASMANSFIKILRNRKVKGGCFTVPYGIKMKNKFCSTTNASHPIPDSNGVLGTRRILEILEKGKKNDMVVMFLSGGASALMPLPIDIISLGEKQDITKKLLSAGATIHEMNTVRKHLSKVKGGRLAEIINKRFRVLTLILSDVVEDKIDVIASGPTVPDMTTFQDTKNVLLKYKLWKNQKLISKKLKDLIIDGISGNIRDTPKPGNPIFTNIHNVIIGNNNIACKNIKLFFEKRGIKTMYLGSSFTGKSKDLGHFLFRLVDDFPSISTPYAFVFGGETTVDLKNKISGIGGRNQEAVLSAASRFEHLDQDIDFTISSFGTDGIDGNSQAAGAVVNPVILSRITRKGLNMSEYLKNHDSNTFFNKVNSALYTKITGTNVNDVSIVCRLK
ncbi:MAG: glycerate kinase [Nitrososphaeraceae archaeon]